MKAELLFSTLKLKTSNSFIQNIIIDTLNTQIHKTFNLL